MSLIYQWFQIDIILYIYKGICYHIHFWLMISIKCNAERRSNQILYKNKYYSIYATLYNSTHNLVLSFLTPSWWVMALMLTLVLFSCSSNIIASTVPNQLPRLNIYNSAWSIHKQSKSDGNKLWADRPGMTYRGNCLWKIHICTFITLWY